MPRSVLRAYRSMFCLLPRKPGVRASCGLPGPKGHTIGMNIKADNLGLKFNRTGIYRRDNGTLIPTPTEEDVARLLHWEYKPPEIRGLGEKGKFHP